MTPRPARAASFLALAVLAPVAGAQTFTIIGLPDTQNYSENYPAIYAGQTQWIADHADALDIRYVSHYGDVVQHGDQIPEWVNADISHTILDATGIPNGVTAGNHDITPAGSSGTPYIPQYFEYYFGPDRYAGNAWYRGASPSGMSSYQVFDGGGMEWLALHVECDTPLRELRWAQGVLDRNRDKPVVFTTHRYLQDAEDYTGGVPVVASGRYPEIWYAVEGVYPPDGIQSEQLWNWFVRRNPNIFLVNCGHFHEEFRQSSTNMYGSTVHEVLADYQDDPNGGNGWLRIMEFDLAQEVIRFDSYSSYLDQFRTANESKFTLAVDFDRYFERRPTVVLQQDVNDYQGTQDTWINEDAPNTSYGQNDTRHSDDDTANGLFSDDRGQALIRFDELVGAAGAGRVPAGATVVSAHLVIEIVEDVDFLYDADFYLHRVFVPWSETSTWNSLVDGLSGNEISGVIGFIEGDNDPNGDGLRRLDVTSTVQAWVDGEPNWGFAILPEIISGNDDGIEIATSENPNTLLRPRLEVVYEFDCGYTQYGVAAAPANTLELDGIGAPKLGQFVKVRTSGATFPVIVCVMSYGQASVPGLGGQVLIDAAQLGPLVVAAAPDGEIQWDLPVPANPNLAGASVYFQSLSPDALQPEGFALSNGLRAQLCP